MYIINYSSKEFAELSKKVDTIIIPIGAVEAHGDHLPLGTDIFSPRVFLDGIEKKMGSEIWIAPEVPYGVCGDLSCFAGTVTMPSEALSQYLFYICKSFYFNGVKKIVFLNGHGGNTLAINLAVEKLTDLGASTMLISWWADYSKEILTVTSSQGHGGEDETACILAYDDSLVKAERGVKNDIKLLYNVEFSGIGKTLYPQGYNGDPSLATKEKGEKIFALLTESMVKDIRLFMERKYFE